MAHDYGITYSLEHLTRRRLRGCVGCMAIAIGGCVLLCFAAWVLHEQRLKWVLALAIGGPSMAILGREVARRTHWRKKLQAGAMPTPLANLLPGPVYTAGLVGFNMAPKPAPLGVPPCEFYRVVVTAVGFSDVMFEGRSSDELVLEDGLGAKLTVKLDGVGWHITRSRELDSSPDAPNADVMTYLRERGLPTDRAVRVRVEWIAPHELVYVRGRADLIADAAKDAYRSEAHSETVMSATKESPVLLALEPIDAA